MQRVVPCALLLLTACANQEDVARQVPPSNGPPSVSAEHTRHHSPPAGGAPRGGDRESRPTPPAKAPPAKDSPAQVRSEETEPTDPAPRVYARSRFVWIQE